MGDRRSLLAKRDIPVPPNDSAGLENPAYRGFSRSGERDCPHFARTARKRISVFEVIEQDGIGFKGRKRMNKHFDFQRLSWLDPIFHRSNIPSFRQESKT
jgi:hypothetical protein